MGGKGEARLIDKDFRVADSHRNHPSFANRIAVYIRLIPTCKYDQTAALAAVFCFLFVEEID